MIDDEHEAVITVVFGAGVLVGVWAMLILLFCLPWLWRLLS